MTCTHCDRHTADDRETGYIGSGLCSDCAAAAADDVEDAEAFDAAAYFEALADDEAFEAAREEEVFGVA